MSTTREPAVTPTRLSDKCLSWASILDPQTAAQATVTASMPFVDPHLALMPDAHLGKGATVGSVIPSKGALMPAAVGVDIACGMRAVRTDLTREQLSREDLHRIRLGLERDIQLGHGAPDGRHAPAGFRVTALESYAADNDVDPDAYYAGWRGQLGSLGGGNHFIELVTDEQGRIWLFLHSGSRGVGNKIATHFIRQAQRLMADWHISLPDRDLAYLVDSHETFWSYWRAMQWATRYAWENRDEMMDRFVGVVVDVTGAVAVEESIHCHHNYTARERHFGRDLYVTRKGAIDAHEGVMGLIPGSMGAASYVVEGLGDRASVCSAPHGAGRVHSRRRAKEVLSFSDLQRQMAERGVEWSGAEGFLDEAPGAYKDIDTVMNDAAGLVRVKHVFRQLVNVKGA